jgi:hypothetical protein
MPGHRFCIQFVSNARTVLSTPFSSISTAHNARPISRLQQTNSIKPLNLTSDFDSNFLDSIPANVSLME